MLILDTTETIASLQAFRKRNADAQRIHGQLSAQPTTVDLAHYRSVLRNQAVVDEAEKILRDFKPVTYDVSTQIKAIETFEAKAVSIVLLPILSCKEGPMENALIHCEGLGGQGEGDDREDRRGAQRPPGHPRQH